MNKRIKELDKQAKLWAVDNTNFPISSHIPAGYTEKFAELIVRECAKFMDENSGYNDSDGCWFPEPEDMLKHFGVEE